MHHGKLRESSSFYAVESFRTVLALFSSSKTSSGFADPLHGNIWLVEVQLAFGGPKKPVDSFGQTRHSDPKRRLNASMYKPRLKMFQGAKETV